MSDSGETDAASSAASSSYLERIENPLTNQVLCPHSTMHRLNSQVSNLTEPSAGHDLQDLALTGVSSLVDASRFGSDRSVGSTRSKSSNLSDRIHKASRRGEERAFTRSVASDEDKKKKKKKKSSKKSSRSVDVGSVVKQKAEMLSPGRESGGHEVVVDMSALLKPEKEKKKGESEGIVEMSALLEQKPKAHSDERSKKSKSSKSHRSKRSSGVSLGSQLNPNKYTDLEYLTKSATSKFEKGVSLMKKGKFQMARDKFRAALKARLLLYEDISHKALVPLHEILGHVELKLGDLDKATLHFNAAKEVCDGHLKMFDEEGGADNASEHLMVIIERIETGLESVKVGRSEGIKDSVSVMDFDIVDSIIDDLSRFDEINKHPMRKASMNFESIAEEDEEEEGGEPKLPIVNVLPPMLKTNTKDMSGFGEHRLRMTYISKSQVAEEMYNLKQYEMALTSFHQARSALVNLSVSGDYLRQGTDSILYNQLRDEVDKALISERISDCHVQRHSRAVMYSEKNIDYVDVIDQLIETKTKLELHIDRYGNPGNKAQEDASLDTFATEMNSDVNELKELIKTTVKSLTRVYSKQGLWCAHLNKHEMALHFYHKSLSVSSESRSRKNRFSVNTHIGVFAAHVNSMMTETELLLSRVAESESLESTLSYDNAEQLLVVCDDPEALWVALYMARSHHFLGSQALKSQPDVALKHYFSAYNLILVADRKHSTSNLKKSLSSTGGVRQKFNSATTLEEQPSRNITIRVRSLEVLTDAAGFGRDMNSFMHSCDTLKMVESVHISRSLFSLGNSSLALKWINKSMEGMTDAFSTGPKRQAEVVSYMLSILVKASPNQSESDELVIANPLALYEGGLPTFTEGYEDKSRVYLYWALEEVHQRLHIDALYTADQALQHIKEIQKPIERSQLDEYMWIIDSQIAISLKGDQMKQVLDKLRLRMDLVTQWRSDEVLELTKELQRMACFHSIQGEHSECKHLLEHALGVVTSVEGGDWALELDITKLLAVTYDCLGHTDKAIRFYSRALDLERKVERDEHTSKRVSQTCCALLNVISYCYLLAGDCEVALANVMESVQTQKDMSDDQVKNPLYAETLILYGNILAAKGSLSQAAFYYDSAISSNPNKSPLEPTNIRAWYNKGVTQFRSGDIVGSGHSFGIILDAIEENSNFVSPEVSYVLNAIGNIHFSNKLYAKAIEFYVESLDKSGRFDLQVGSLCNIAAAYFMRKEYSKSEKYFIEAMHSADLAGEEFKDAKASVASKLAYVLYKQSIFDRAYELYTEASSLGTSNPEFVSECESSAETCRVQMRKQSDNASVPLKKRKDITAKKPTFEHRIIPVAGGQSATRYRDVVHTPNEKLLTMLGVEHSERGSFPSTLMQRNDLCDKRLGYLLKQTTGPRTQYALDFHQKLLNELDSKFDQLKKTVDIECPSISDSKSSQASLIKVADAESKRKLLLQKQFGSKVVGPSVSSFGPRSKNVVSRYGSSTF